MKILLIEDNLNIIKGLEYAFKQESLTLNTVTTLTKAMKYLQEQQVNLIILDITLPDGDGITFFQDYIQSLNIPVIFLTAKDEEEVIVKCFNLGCDDYVTKPFSTKELLARVKRILLKAKQKSLITVQNISFDLDKMVVSKNNVKIELTSLELKILQMLFLNLGKVVTRTSILDKIWEWTGNDVDDHTITVYLKRIREKLGEDIIVTVKGIGYLIDEK